MHPHYQSKSTSHNSMHLWEQQGEPHVVPVLNACYTLLLLANGDQLHCIDIIILFSSKATSYHTHLMNCLLIDDEFGLNAKLQIAMMVKTNRRSMFRTCRVEVLSLESLQ